MDVSADGHWSAYGLDVRFLSEDACGFFDYELDLGLRDSLETFQAVDDGIYIVLVGLHSWDRLFYGYSLILDVYDLNIEKWISDIIRRTK